jgi:hypothetical protein
MVILKATSFLEGHKRNIGMTCSITRTIMSLFHGHEGFFVKRLKILNRERIKKYEKKYYLNEIVIINSFFLTE